MSCLRFFLVRRHRRLEVLTPAAPSKRAERATGQEVDVRPRAASARARVPCLSRERRLRHDPRDRAVRVLDRAERRVFRPPAQERARLLHVGHRGGGQHAAGPVWVQPALGAFVAQLEEGATGRQWPWELRSSFPPPFSLA